MDLNVFLGFYVKAVEKAMNNWCGEDSNGYEFN